MERKQRSEAPPAWLDASGSPRDGDIVLGIEDCHCFISC